MHEEKNQNCNTQTKIEVQVIPNIESKTDCGGKIILSITCDGSKLTKADAGYNSELTQEIWVTTKMTKADSGKIQDIDVNVHERCGSKLTKADSGLV